MKEKLLVIGSSRGGIEVVPQFVEELRNLGVLDKVSIIINPHIERTDMCSAVGGHYVRGNEILDFKSLLKEDGEQIRVLSLSFVFANLHIGSISDLFTGCSLELGDKLIACVASGKGIDGTTGLKTVDENGGISLVINTGGPTYSGEMPNSAMRTELVHMAGSVSEIAQAVADQLI